MDQKNMLPNANLGKENEHVEIQNRMNGNPEHVRIFTEDPALVLKQFRRYEI